MTLSPSSILSRVGRYIPSTDALPSSKSDTLALYICCLSVRNSSSPRFVDSKLTASPSPSLYFCSPLMRSDCAVIFLK